MKYIIENKEGICLAEFNNKVKANKSLYALCEYFPDNTLNINWD